MRAPLLLFALILGGCGANQVAYEPKAISVPEAHAVIEQVMMEQPQKFRPEGVVFTDDFIGLSIGTLNQRKGRGAVIPVGNIALATGGSSGMSTDVSVRMYYTTIAKTRIYEKRDWHIIDVLGTEGELLQRVYTRSDAKAKRFADAIDTLRR
jgi:hypothetical protein